MASSIRSFTIWCALAAIVALGAVRPVIGQSEPAVLFKPAPGETGATDAGALDPGVRPGDAAPRGSAGACLLPGGAGCQLVSSSAECTGVFFGTYMGAGSGCPVQDCGFAQSQTNCQDYEFPRVPGTSTASMGTPNSVLFRVADAFRTDGAFTHNLTQLCWWGAYSARSGTVFSCAAPDGSVPFTDHFFVKIMRMTGQLPDVTQLVAEREQGVNMTVTRRRVCANNQPFNEYHATLASPISLQPNSCYALEVRNPNNNVVNWFWGHSQFVTDGLSWQDATEDGYTAVEAQTGTLGDRAWCMNIGLTIFHTCAVASSPICTNPDSNGQARMDINGGGFSNFGPGAVGLQLGDSVQFATSGPITNVCFWGFWVAPDGTQPNGPDVPDFRFTIYDSTGPNNLPNTTSAPLLDGTAGVTPGFTSRRQGMNYNIAFPAFNVVAGHCYYISIAFPQNNADPAHAFRFAWGLAAEAPANPMSNSQAISRGGTTSPSGPYSLFSFGTDPAFPSNMSWVFDRQAVTPSCGLYCCPDGTAAIPTTYVFRISGVPSGAPSSLPWSISFPGTPGCLSLNGVVPFSGSLPPVLTADLIASNINCGPDQMAAAPIVHAGFNTIRTNPAGDIAYLLIEVRGRAGCPDPPMTFCVGSPPCCIPPDTSCQPFGPGFLTISSVMLDGPGGPDCNHNGVDDVVDKITGVLSEYDSNNNGIPDQCEGICSPAPLGYVLTPFGIPPTSLSCGLNNEVSFSAPSGMERGFTAAAAGFESFGFGVTAVTMGAMPNVSDVIVTSVGQAAGMPGVTRGVVRISVVNTVGPVFGATANYGGVMATQIRVSLLDEAMQILDTGLVSNNTPAATFQPDMPEIEADAVITNNTSCISERGAVLRFTNPVSATITGHGPVGTVKTIQLVAVGAMLSSFGGLETATLTAHRLPTVTVDRMYAGQFGGAQIMLDPLSTASVVGSGPAVEIASAGLVANADYGATVNVGCAPGVVICLEQPGAGNGSGFTNFSLCAKTNTNPPSIKRIDPLDLFVRHAAVGADIYVPTCVVTPDCPNYRMSYSLSGAQGSWVYLCPGTQTCNLVSGSVAHVSRWPSKCMEDLGSSGGVACVALKFEAPTSDPALQLCLPRPLPCGTNNFPPTSARTLYLRFEGTCPTTYAGITAVKFVGKGGGGSAKMELMPPSCPNCGVISIVQGPITNPANGHTYYRLSNSNWTCAEGRAVALGGHLVTVNNAAENTFVLNTFANAPGSGRVWLGYNDVASEGNFVWPNGENPGYTNWEPGEPNNAGGNEDYVAMYSGNGRWIDVGDLANPPGIGQVYGVIEIPTTLGPPNDNCGSATAIAAYGTTAFSNSGANTDGTSPANCGTGDLIGADIWYTYTACASGSHTVDTCTGGSYDSVIIVYTGSCGSLTQIGCNDDAGCGAGGLSSSLSWNATSGTTYRIRVGGYQGATGSGTLTLAGPMCGPACPCDWNQSGNVNSQDFFDFLTAFFGGNADFNHNGVTNSQDFFDFLVCFFQPPAGC